MTVKRRQFLQTAGHTASGIALSQIPQAAKAARPVTQAANGFELLILATKWGNDDTYDVFFAKAKRAGYDGAELWYPPAGAERNEMLEAANKHGMRLGFLCGNGEVNPAQNLAAFKSSLEEALLAKPLYINCHTAKDFFTLQDLKPFFQHTLDASRRTGVPVYHESHRGRALYSLPVTSSVLSIFPTLKLTLDASHWCNVHESLLDDQQPAMQKVLPQVEHIHARIGHAEGPQVSDPRAPEWKAALDAHLAWWDAVVERKKKLGERLTILTEFGPPDYMPTLPYTRQTLASQWDINVHMLQLLRKRYA